MSGEGAELAGAARATIKSTGAVASTTPDDDAHGSGDDSPGTLARLGAELNGAGAGASSPGVAFADTHEARKASRVGRRVNRLGDTGDAGAGSSSMRQISRSSRHSRASRGPGGRVTKEPFDSSLLRASIASHHKIGSDRQFTSYAITVKYKDNSWIVNRRYSQFLDLHTQLSAEHKERVPQLPPKTLSANPSDPQFLEMRRVALERYLHGILVDPVLREHRSLATFLALDPMASVSGYIDHDWMSRTGAAPASNRGKRGWCVVL